MIILAAGHQGSAEPLGRIPVAVFAPFDIKDSLVTRMCAEAQAIWTPAGIALDCQRVGETDAVRTLWLDVEIDERKSSLPDGPAALGWIPFTVDGPQPSIHVSRSNVEALLRLTPGVQNMTISSHDTLLGRALGRALAHEVGHYVLRSKAHSASGLMRALRRAEEFFQVTRDGFKLSAQERAAAALHVLQATPARSSGQGDAR